LTLKRKRKLVLFIYEYPINPARERDGLVSKYLKEMVLVGTQINNEYMKTKEGSNSCAHVL
jgi:hypothetical protein